ncbi:MAG: phenylalanine--tRNA ligase beta subunit-related protein [Chloroflexota bacterium]|nr:MAG: hypothetical protein DIU68_05930 [Chloroflexota bacterium]
MSLFQYHADIIAAFPGIVGGVALVRGLRMGATPAELAGEFRAEQQAVLQRLGDRPLSELPSLAAWRAAFRAFGVDPTQYRSAAEALLRRLTRKGDIPHINTLVDIGNLVSIRYALPVAAMDLRGIEGGITVRYADGSEPFRNLNQTEVEHPAPGEVIFADAAGTVVARRWCWRQADVVGARDDTTDILFIVEGLHAQAQQDVTAALEDLRRLLSAYAPGVIETGLLHAGHPAF